MTENTAKPYPEPDSQDPEERKHDQVCDSIASRVIQKLESMQQEGDIHNKLVQRLEELGMSYDNWLKGAEREALNDLRRARPSDHPDVFIGDDGQEYIKYKGGPFGTRVFIIRNTRRDCIRAAGMASS